MNVHKRKLLQRNARLDRQQRLASWYFPLRCVTGEAVIAMSNITVTALHNASTSRALRLLRTLAALRCARPAFPDGSRFGRTDCTLRIHRSSNA
jgi:hypothetical protein